MADIIRFKPPKGSEPPKQQKKTPSRGVQIQVQLGAFMASVCYFTDAQLEE